MQEFIIWQTFIPIPASMPMITMTTLQETPAVEVSIRLS
jgi:hypothetical protein